MMLKTTFTNGKNHRGGLITVSTKIPLTELHQIQQINLSAETIVALLNEKENLYSSKQNISTIWKSCQHCQTIFISYHKQNQKYCSRECNGVYRGEEWKKHGHKGRSHWSQQSKDNLVQRMTGDSNPSWKGGITYRSKKGYYNQAKLKYLRCPEQYKQMARKDGYVLEYRLAMAMQINRPLTREECVHHIDHNPMNNQIGNLMLFATNRDHKKYEAGHPIQPLWQPLHP